MFRSFIFGSVDLKSPTTNFALLALRLFTGASMALAHGLGKLPPSDGFISGTENLGFPLPIFFAWAAGLSEFLGGILLALGLFTRPAALLMSFTMLTAAFLRHADDPFTGKEKALLYLAICIFLMLTGSGKYGMDGFFRPQKPKYYI